MHDLNICTFSIVAHDPGKAEWGVAVASKFLGVGAVVPWARAGAGAVATQSYANLTYGTRGLELMEQGKPAQTAVQTLIEADPDAALRQVGMVDRDGRAAAYTGAGCHAWAGHVEGSGYACQGNILAPGTVEAMAARFEAERSGLGELADWLVAALAAGQAAGGDSRGRQAAAVLVVRADGGYGGNNDRYLDLRVDDDPDPISRLRHLVDLHHLYFGQTRREDLVPLASVAGVIQEILRCASYDPGAVPGRFDETTRQSLAALVGIENLEERWNGEGDVIDIQVVRHLQGLYARPS